VRGLQGRKRHGWKAEFRQAVQDAAGDLPALSDADILSVVKQVRRESRIRPEIRLAAKA
jgi:hypothetical protein